MILNNPQLNPKDLQEKLGIDQLYYKPDELAKQKHDFTNYIKEHEEKFKNFNFKINEKIYEFWKKKELETF
jgi:hypothetical protein